MQLAPNLLGLFSPRQTAADAIGVVPAGQIRAAGARPRACISQALSGNLRS